MGVYSGFQSTAKRLVGKYGKQITVKRTTETGYDPLNNTSQTSTETINGFAMLSLSEGQREPGITPTKDGQATICADSELRVSDTFTLDGDKWEITSITYVAPGGVLVLQKVTVSA